MNATKSIVGLVPTAMAVGLVGANLNYLKHRKKSNLVKLGVGNIVGVSLIKATAQAGSW